MDAWYFIFCFAAVVAVLVRTVTKEEIFKEPRQWLQAYAGDGRHRLLLRKLAYMPTCEFCCSFWVTLALAVGVFGYRLAFDDWRGYLVSVGPTMALANVALGAFDLLRIDLRKEKGAAEHLERRRSA